ncbi:guanylate cyclase (plasmid) [Mycolicibacterium arabiense]|uniref:Guanylate cyclase n=1 Tax=Mycolicibacterium arabiense TaxID=1286181 RepID=A0A7I7RQH9_9MYCO|nr:adenylate/guanylate cyclase domain-containing protein [Mycolicibacterium arabiense]MCV7372160.1 adenylate/guanylate cyclase domain-containing protein [Mycolicibacterium arabiense]BBY46822.1 guanylate cyclase [Mycolicibacterium arabiense]
MGLADDVSTGIDGVLDPTWAIRNGQVVPETTDIALKDGAVRLDATYLYADMADSTGLAQQYSDTKVAKVIRCYLNAATRIIRARGGHIRSFDGDRVMGIFIGGSKNSNSAKAALNINWAVRKVIQDRLASKWDNFDWTVNHGIGIDTGQAMLVRGGVHGQNDIISIGGAPNIAANLSDLRQNPLTIFSDVYSRLSKETKFRGDKDMWQKMGTATFGGKSVLYYSSSYTWKP